ncbi:hypothetical protein HT031_002029 [Scenedesmus sp. PABB004]|nr:hypothetical protein HT031_002029 [Scenedesmus sp. PABB004]
MASSPPEAQEPRRPRTSVDIAVRSAHDHLAEALADMEALGIVTSLAGKVRAAAALPAHVRPLRAAAHAARRPLQIVGGVAVSQSYYAHVLQTEGHSEAPPPCQLLIARAQRGGGVTMLPAQQAALEGGEAGLPRESPVLSKIMSPAALAELHWARVPAVAIFGCFVADDDGAEVAQRQQRRRTGASPSPPCAHSAATVRDRRGRAAELKEAAAAGIPISPSMTGPHPEELMTQLEVFFKQFKYPDSKCFILRDWGFLIFGADLADAVATFNDQLKEALVAGAEGGDRLPGDGDGDGAPAGAPARASADGGGASGGGAATPRGLHGALAHAFRRLGAHVGMLRTQSLPTDEGGAGDGGAGVRSLKAPGERGPVSEPSSPMIGADLPDSIRVLSTVAHRQSSEYRVPSFAVGLKPW